MRRPAYFPLSLIAIVWLARLEHLRPAGALLAVGVTWLTVLAHELGHVAVIKASGGRVRRVLVLPFMGMTCHDNEQPRHLAALAIAGPLAGAVFGAGALLALDSYASPDSWTVWALRVVLRAGLVDNLVFNMLPLGRLDGAFFVHALRERRVERAFRPQVERTLVAAWNSARRGSGAPYARLAPAPARAQAQAQPHPRPVRPSLAYAQAREQLAAAQRRVSTSVTADTL